MKAKSTFPLLAMLGLIFAIALPLTAAADGCPPDDPHCAIEPPQSIEVNPDPRQADGSPVELDEPGVLAPVKISVPMPLPRRVDPLDAPLRMQASGDNTCGVQALGMALDALNDQAPTSEALLRFLEDQGMLYDFGTGVEELAYAAQTFGYEDSLPFHGWTLADLQNELAAGRPVVVSLGANGEGNPGHFVTVTGISSDGIAFNDPTLGKQVISIEAFLRLWALEGSSGVAVRQEPPAADSADYAPWVAISAGLMALISQTPLALRRKGIGGRLDMGGVADSATPTSEGCRWVFKQVPVYKMQEVQDGWTYTDVEVPIYGNERYVMYYRKETVGGVPRRIVLDGQMMTLYSPSTTRYVPVYGTRQVVTGYRTETRREPNMVTQEVRVGTEWGWVLEDVPEVVAEDTTAASEGGGQLAAPLTDGEPSTGGNPRRFVLDDRIITLYPPARTGVEVATEPSGTNPTDLMLDEPTSDPSYSGPTAEDIERARELLEEIERLSIPWSELTDEQWAILARSGDYFYNYLAIYRRINHDDPLMDLFWLRSKEVCPICSIPGNPSFVAKFYDPYADFHDVASTQLTVGSPPYTYLDENPNDPTMQINAVNPLWFSIATGIIGGLLAPFANARYMESLQPNVDVDLHYNLYWGKCGGLYQGFGIPGATIVNESAEDITIQGIKVTGMGYDYTAGAVNERTEYISNFPVADPVISPGDTSSIYFVGVNHLYPPSLYVEVKLLMKANTTFHLPRWRIWSDGRVEQLQ